MAKVYAVPKGVHVPDFAEYEVDGRFSHEKMREVDDKFYADLRFWLKASGYRHKLTGKVIGFPVADGQALYMIINGTGLIHLPLMDAYQIPDAHSRGLRATDLAQMVARNEKLAEFFASRAK